MGGSSACALGPARRPLPPRVLHERRQLADAVVELAGGHVVVLRHPVDLLGAGAVGGSVDRLDQRRADAAAAHGGVDVKVLQVAVGADRPGGGVEEIVDEADEPPGGVDRDEAVRVDRRVEQPPPRLLGDVLRQRLLVEHQVALPQKIPRGAVAGFDGADGEGGHRHACGLRVRETLTVNEAPSMPRRRGGVEWGASVG